MNTKNKIKVTFTEFIDESISDNKFYGLFSRVNRANDGTIVNNNTIIDMIMNDDVLNDKVEYITDKSGSFILLVKQNYDIFNKLLKFRINNQLGLTFNKVITNINMLD